MDHTAPVRTRKRTGSRAGAAGHLLREHDDAIAVEQEGKLGVLCADVSARRANGARALCPSDSRAALSQPAVLCEQNTFVVELGLAILSDVLPVRSASMGPRAADCRPEKRMFASTHARPHVSDARGRIPAWGEREKKNDGRAGTPWSRGPVRGLQRAQHPARRRRTRQTPRPRGPRPSSTSRAFCADFAYIQSPGSRFQWARPK